MALAAAAVLLLGGGLVASYVDTARRPPLSAYVDSATLDKVAKPANPEPEPSMIERLNKRFHSTEGVVVTVLENEASYIFHGVATGEVSTSEPSTASSLLHSLLLTRGQFSDPKNASLISASVLRHDLPVELAEDLGRVGVVLTPVEKGCAFPNDAQSNGAPMKQWMQTCLPRCVANHSDPTLKTWRIEAPTHAGCLDATADPALWADEDVLNSGLWDKCPLIGVTPGADCSTGNHNLTAAGAGLGVRKSAKFSQCVCFEDWDEAFKIQRAVNSNNHNEVFVGAYEVDAIFYTTPTHYGVNQNRLWTNFTSDAVRRRASRMTATHHRACLPRPCERSHRRRADGLVWCVWQMWCKAARRLEAVLNIGAKSASTIARAPIPVVMIDVEAFDDFGFQEALCPPVADAPIIS